MLVLKDNHLSDINASILFPPGMPVPEVSDHSDGVEASILCQRVGDHFHGLGKAPHTVGLHASE